MKRLDWSNEGYVRAYRSDSPLWNLLGYEAQALYLMLLRKLDAAGVLSLGGLTPWDAILSYFPDADSGAITRALERLLERGFLVYDVAGEKLVDPEFVERETASKSSRQRQRESRERRRSVTFRDEMSQAVTTGHDRSRPVTSGHDRSQLVTTEPDSDHGVTNRDSTAQNVTRSHDRSQAVTTGHSLPLPLPIPLPIPLSEWHLEHEKPNAQQRRVGKILSVFTDHDRELPNRSIGAWARRLSQYAERHGDPDAGCEALVADLESIAEAGKLISSAYALKIVDGQLEQRRTGQGIHRPRRRRPDHGAHPDTRRAAEALD